MRISKILSLLRSQLIDYQRYESGQLKVIGLTDLSNSDCSVRDRFSYAEWIQQHDQFRVVKVEGIEQIDKVCKQFDFDIKNIHLFVNQKSGKSFNWHRDDVNVYLYVLRGQKTVYMKHQVTKISAGQGIRIPKGHLHRVVSRANTWALSIALK